MPWIGSLILCAAVSSPGNAQAARSAGQTRGTDQTRASDQDPSGAPSTATFDATLAEANDAYLRGQWDVTIRLLRPLVPASLDRLDDPARRDAVLMFLDARLRLLQLQGVALDPLPDDEELQRTLLLMVRHTPRDALPPEVYSIALYRAYDGMQRTIDEAAGERCQFERSACEADNAKLMEDFNQLSTAHTRLRGEFEAQDVEVRDFGVRTRALALLPFGLGHFYNNKPRLGATFLATELAFGATALGLMLTRVVKYDCSRTAGFSPGSLVCDVPFTDQNRREILLVRKSEEVFGWLFLGTVVTDIVLSQILFEPYGEIRRKTVPRSTLDDPSARDSDAEDNDTDPIARWRAGPSMLRRGLGMGFTLDF